MKLFLFLASTQLSFAASFQNEGPDFLCAIDAMAVASSTKGQEEAFRIVRKIAQARHHVVPAQFEDRGVNKDPAAISKWAQKLKGVDVKGVFFLEPIPRRKFAPIETVMVEGNKLAPIADANGRIELPVTEGGVIFLKYVGDQVEISWDIPKGYRVAIQENSKFKKSGFAGGHTRAAWKKTLTDYRDKIEIKNQKEISFSFPKSFYGVSLKGSEPSRIKATSYHYAFGTKGQRFDVKAPKTIVEVESGKMDLVEFEYLIASYFNSGKPPTQPGIYKVPVPVGESSTGKTELVFTVAVGDDLTVSSWWLGSENF